MKEELSRLTVCQAENVRLKTENKQLVVKLAQLKQVYTHAHITLVL